MKRWTCSRLRRRALLVATNAVNSLLVPLLNPIVSFLVVRWASVGVWGAFVQVLIAVQLAAHVIGWGNKEYLLREFSLNPARIAAAWQSSLASRLVLYAAGCGMLLLGLPPERALWLMAWGLGLVLAQSCDVFVVYRKDFAFASLVELAGLATQVALLASLAPRIDVDGLIAVFAVAALLKTGAYLARYRRQVWGKFAWLGRPGARYFALALPFFLLGLSGLIQSRIDLYAVSAFLPKEQVGQYQVFTTLILYVQSVSNLVLTPFLKGLYRLTYRSILGISARLFALGALIVLPGLAAVGVALSLYFRFDLPPVFLLAGGLQALPVFFYLPIIYALYKAGAQVVVMKLNVLGIAVNFAGSVLLLPARGMMGAVIAAALAQWAMLAGYAWLSRSLREVRAAVVPELP